MNDLGSTNGSKLDGKAVTKALLSPDAVVDIGRTRIVYRLIAGASKRSGSSAGLPKNG